MLAPGRTARTCRVLLGCRRRPPSRCEQYSSGLSLSVEAQWPESRAGSVPTVHVLRYLCHLADLVDLGEADQVDLN